MSAPLADLHAGPMAVRAAQPLMPGPEGRAA